MHRWYATAMAATQVVDMALLNAAVFAARLTGDQRSTDPAAFLAAAARWSQGRLLHYISKRGLLTEAARAVYQTVVDQRNYLAHRFFRERVGLLDSQGGISKAISDLKEIVRSTIVAEQVLANVTLKGLGILGQGVDLSPSAARKLAEKVQTDSRTRALFEAIGLQPAVVRRLVGKHAKAVRPPQ